MISRRGFLAGLSGLSFLLMGHHKSWHEKGPPQNTATTTTTVASSYEFGWDWS